VVAVLDPVNPFHGHDLQGITPGGILLGEQLG